ncbi:hypothetical protein [Flavivirga jejuensis]|uniref:Lipocalin-like domain-containing protein n=1 Tax=Flavivirga jejuensis TaxID=870487 RepID=A0ABT8WP39_9FLAO|nr:hypothetical protein [Flavivirga jejuensis]MDO5974944.1 hypothetical protein [Flavivirga jejuensis]
MNDFKIGIVAIFLISLIGCSSEQNLNNPTDANSIFGKWKLVEKYLSAGGPQYKVDVENGAEYSFSNNGDFVSDDFFGCTTGEFELESNTLNLMYDCDKFQDYNGLISYSLSFESNFLTLIPTTIICVEGCSYKFKKISN